MPQAWVTTSTCRCCHPCLWHWPRSDSGFSTLFPSHFARSDQRESWEQRKPISVRSRNTPSDFPGWSLSGHSPRRPSLWWQKKQDTYPPLCQAQQCTSSLPAWEWTHGGSTVQSHCWATCRSGHTASCSFKFWLYRAYGRTCTVEKKGCGPLQRPAFPRGIKSSCGRQWGGRIEMRGVPAKEYLASPARCRHPLQRCGSSSLPSTVRDLPMPHTSCRITSLRRPQSTPIPEMNGTWMSTRRSLGFGKRAHTFRRSQWKRRGSGAGRVWGPHHSKCSPGLGPFLPLQSLTSSLPAAPSQQSKLAPASKSSA